MFAAILMRSVGIFIYRVMSGEAACNGQRMLLLELGGMSSIIIFIYRVLFYGAACYYVYYFSIWTFKKKTMIWIRFLYGLSRVGFMLMIARTSLGLHYLDDSGT